MDTKTQPIIPCQLESISRCLEQIELGANRLLQLLNDPDVSSFLTSKEIEDLRDVGGLVCTATYYDPLDKNRLAEKEQMRYECELEAKLFKAEVDGRETE